MKHVSRWIAAGLLIALSPLAASAQSPRAADLVKPQFLSDTSAVEAGKPFRVGVLLRIRPRWHVYWKNPGDSGQAVSVTFDLPAGFKASELAYPVPTKFLQPGDLVAYGYSEEVMVMATITPPGTLSPGEVAISAKLKYLVCEDVCLPGKAELSLTLPTRAPATPANEELFAEWTRQVPAAGGAAVAIADVKPSAKSNKHTLDVTWKTPADNVEFFPGKAAALNIHDVTVTNKGKQTRVTFAADPLAGRHADAAALDSVIVYTDDRGVRRGIDVAVPLEQGK